METRTGNSCVCTRFNTKGVVAEWLSTTPKFRSVRGFTLVELMVTVVVLALLTSISVSSYRNYMMRTHRTEATAALLQVQVAQEKFYLQNRTYATNAQLTLAQPNGLGLLATTTPGGYYTIRILNADPTTDFSAMATPDATKGQAADTACQSISINQSGQKSASDGSNDTTATCWR
jgi:type IV pilus assembly protein PilE